MKNAITYLFIGAILLSACAEEDKQVVNPYDSQVVGQSDEIVYGDTAEIKPNTIQDLHKNIFKPTCANSGCHDGNFEPDFRTIESSYNTLVNQPIIKNDEMNPLTARVTPGSAATSMIMRRLTTDLNGNSGTMPLVTEPGSDWYDKKEDYIKRIETWINNGALNQRNEAPTSTNFPVQLLGVNALVNGNLVSRSNLYEPLLVSEGTSEVEIWFSLVDESLSTDLLTGAKFNYSLEANNFDVSNETAMQYMSTPVNQMGFYGKVEAHHFRVILNTSAYKKNEVIWMRCKISDGVNQSELPNDNSLFRSKKYVAIKII